MTRLEAIRARLKAATPGPWRVVIDEWDETGRTVEGIVSHTGEALVNTESGYNPPKFDDAQFIAHARADVAFLLDVIDGLTWDKQEREKIRDSGGCGPLA